MPSPWSGTSMTDCGRTRGGIWIRTILSVTIRPCPRQQSHGKSHTRPAPPHSWHDSTRGLRGQHLNVHHVNAADKVIAFHRWQDGGPRDDVVIVLNFANRGYDSYTVGFPREGRWRVRLNSDWQGYSPDFGSHTSFDTTASPPGRDGMPFQADVGLGPYTAVILSQDG